ncbi:MAG: hypothetical protein ACTMUB_03170 [cyanobacterium endosymbiont of Rhopalodia musculus]|uniref:hypothetical protein n=1 Tax=cyanobacterium endosymbiont of Epithemia clementina EcSB TaxID=3034674 RepID=UPI00247FC77A|nr:hypothetical protein [cyanobacterium endosymbiont of Epithemia clementina EcSB]WGT67212.1 hypothetical protein P3F56_08330 [cyanobacterium endosymbiont of Epithemia clementina EcSB]
MTEPFRFSNGQQANNVEDLIKICEDYPQEGINYLNRGDLENWLTYIGEVNFSQKAKQAREASVSDEEKLKQFLVKIQRKSEPVPLEHSINTSAQPTPEPTSTSESKSTYLLVQWFKNLFKWFKNLFK